jgi:hypothetical protein
VTMVRDRLARDDGKARLLSVAAGQFEREV